MSLIPPFNVAPIEIDNKTGKSRWNRDWWLFLHAMWEQAGGTSDVSDAEAMSMSHRRRGPERPVPELVPSRAQRGRKPDEVAPPRHSFPCLQLTKETYKPLTLIRLYVGLAADIPSGWQLADGTNSTPNMKDLFVVGAGDLYAQGATGGSTTILANNLPAHTHPYEDANTTYTATTANLQPGTGTAVQVVTGLTPGGGDTTRTTDNNTTAATPYLPPYYAAAYIINTKAVTIVTDAKLR